MHSLYILPKRQIEADGPSNSITNSPKGWTDREIGVIAVCRIVRKGARARKWLWSRVPPFLMPPPASRDLKARVPVLRARGHSPQFICNVLGVKKSFVYKTLKYHSKHGVSYNIHARRAGRRRRLMGVHAAAWRQMVKQYPTDHLDELQDRFQRDFGLGVSIATASRETQRLRLTRKKVVIQAREAKRLLQAVYTNRLGELVTNPWQTIYLDESAKDERTVIRRYGFGPEGERLVVDAPFVRGKRYSILPALTLDGIITHKVVEGSVTSEIFADFLREYVVRATVYFTYDDAESL
jgi:transposase